ncbi:hypothetical protein M153_18350001907, partial [Pseudoloma neurophilia]
MIIIFYFIFSQIIKCSDINEEKHDSKDQNKKEENHSEKIIDLSQNCSELKNRYLFSPSFSEAATSFAESQSLNPEEPLDLTTDSSRKNKMLEDKSINVAVNPLKRPLQIEEDQKAKPSTSNPILYSLLLQKKTPSVPCVVSFLYPIALKKNNEDLRKKQNFQKKLKTSELYTDNLDEQP